MESNTSSSLLGKRKHSNLDDEAKDRLRTKIQALREKRKEPALKKQKLTDKTEIERAEKLSKALQEAGQDSDFEVRYDHNVI